MKICKDGRVWGQNNKEAGNHLGILRGRKGKVIKDIILSYKDRSWLYSKYASERLTLYQIAGLCASCPSTIYNWLRKYSIPLREGGVEHWSEEQKQYRRDWNKAHPEINRMKGKHHSEETRRKMSLARQGNKNSNWKGGLTELVKGIRRSPEFYQWRKAVLERDNHTCQDCRAIEGLDVHHIQSILDYPEGVFEVDNGLTLCKDCHKRHTWWQKMRPKKKKEVPR